LGSGKYPLSKVDYFINDRFVGSSDIYPFSISIVPSSLPNIDTSDILKAIGYDSVFNRGEASLTFIVE